MNTTHLATCPSPADNAGITPRVGGASEAPMYVITVGAGYLSRNGGVTFRKEQAIWFWLRDAAQRLAMQHRSRTVQAVRVVEA